MNAGDVLSAAREAGVTLRAEGGKILASPGGLLPPDLRDLIRERKDEILILLNPSPRVLRFDPDRRRRTEEALRDRPCPACGRKGTWRYSPRGDAWCSPCEDARRASPQPAPAQPAAAGPEGLRAAPVAETQGTFLEEGGR